MGKEIKVVLDTNFYISFLLKSEICALIFQQIAKGNIKVFICNQIVGEIFRVATYPRLQKYIKTKEVFKLRDILISADNIIFVKPKPAKIKLKDKDDQKVLETAIRGKVEYLITRNLKDFQQAKKLKSLKIVTPEKFLHILRKKKFL